MSDLRVVYDVTGANLPRLTVPAGVALAGYVTGTGAVPWSAAQLAAHPHMLRIAQSPYLPADQHARADVLDSERGAATLAEAAPWYRNAKQSYDTAARPGQRWPAIYISASQVTPLANQLIHDGITSGPRLWIAHWDLAVIDAVSMLVDSGGPWPVVGVQVHNAGLYDISLFRTDWLNAVSRVTMPAQQLDAYPATLRRQLTSTDGGKTWR